jgi:hypothetical protein
VRGAVHRRRRGAGASARCCGRSVRIRCGRCRRRNDAGVGALRGGPSRRSAGARTASPGAASRLVLQIPAGLRRRPRGLGSRRARRRRGPPGHDLPRGAGPTSRAESVATGGAHDRASDAAGLSLSVGGLSHRSAGVSQGTHAVPEDAGRCGSVRPAAGCALRPCAGISALRQASQDGPDCHGKEGVAGSSPAEGFANRAIARFSRFRSGSSDPSGLKGRGSRVSVRQRARRERVPFGAVRGSALVIIAFGSTEPRTAAGDAKWDITADSLVSRWTRLRR